MCPDTNVTSLYYAGHAAWYNLIQMYTNVMPLFFMLDTWPDRPNTRRGLVSEDWMCPRFINIQQHHHHNTGDNDIFHNKYSSENSSKVRKLRWALLTSVGGPLSLLCNKLQRPKIRRHAKTQPSVIASIDISLQALSLLTHRDKSHLSKNFCPSNNWAALFCGQTVVSVQVVVF